MHKPTKNSLQIFQIESLESRLLASTAPLPTTAAQTGLYAVYYGNQNFTGAATTEIDPCVNFAWNGAAPAANIGPTHFSARWTGTVTPGSTADYTFSVRSSDGVRLWINDTLIINDWNSHAIPATDTGVAHLAAGQPGSLRLEYFASIDPAGVQLSWSSATTALQVIPSQNLAPVNDPLLGPIDKALAFAGQQASATLAGMNGSTAAFPFYTKADGTWATSNVGNWTAGFFGGELWQLASRTNDAALRQVATSWTLPLSADQTFTDDLTFRIFNAYYPLYQATGNPAYKQVILNAAASKVSTWSPVVGAFSSVGVASHSGNPDANFGVLMDHMMDSSLVLWAAKTLNNQTWYNEALQNARTVAANFFRPDGSVYQWGYFNKATGQFVSGENYQGYSDSSAWARAQAWAIYSFSVLYRETGAPDMLADAQRAANYYVSNLPADGVPWWDFNAPGIPNTFRDTSAAAIADSGLLQLARLDPDPTTAASYLNAAKLSLASLLSPAYLAQGTASRGVLLHGAWFVPSPINNGDASLIWGDYYLVEAMNEYLDMPGALPGSIPVPAPAAPTLSLSGNAYANAGGSYALTLGPAYDANGVPSQYLVHWGDGTQSAYSSTGVVTHVYARTGPAQISVDVTDAAGTHAAASALALTVSAPPTISLSGASTVAARATYTLTLGAVTDRGGVVSQYTVHWGDGSTSVYASRGTVSHVYALAGNARILVDLKDATGSYASAGALNVTITAPPVNLFTASADIGSPQTKGWSSFANGTYTVAGAGKDIWNSSDQFRYVYKGVSGNTTIRARVTGIQYTNAWAKAGVMIRNGTAANAAFADVVVTPGGYIAFQWRSKAGGTCSQTAMHGAFAPTFVKLTRSGSWFSAYVSSDGNNWTQLGKAVSISMNSAVASGLAVTSLTPTKTTTATFTNVATG